MYIRYAFMNICLGIVHVLVDKASIKHGKGEGCEIRRQWILGDPNRALLSKPAIAKGCELCFAGAKSVIFITGLCDDGCYYCPVSRDRLNRDVFYVNEVPVSTISEVLLELARSGSRGASITGGDPLVRSDRTIKLVKEIKDHFGDDFHVHLYTSGRYATTGVLRALDRAGLDEIRFHPTKMEFLSRAKAAKENTSMSVGVEIPVAPHIEEWVKDIIVRADRLGLDFVNLNEMEFVEPNARALLARGLRESATRPFTVEGSLETAIRVISWARDNVSIPVHFCPATFKDKIQTRNRLRVASLRDLRWNEEPLASGTLLEYSCIAGKGVLVRREVYPTPGRRPVVAEEIVGDCPD